MGLTIGFATPNDLWRADFDAKQRTLQRLEEVGVDQVYMADHVSFRDGSGTDGFVEIAALSQLHRLVRPLLGLRYALRSNDGCELTCHPRPQSQRVVIEGRPRLFE